MKAICNECGHEQKCCAPPCEKCHSTNIKIVLDKQN